MHNKISYSIQRVSLQFLLYLQFLRYYYQEKPNEHSMEVNLRALKFVSAMNHRGRSRVSKKKQQKNNHYIGRYCCCERIDKNGRWIINCQIQIKIWTPFFSTACFPILSAAPYYDRCEPRDYLVFPSRTFISVPLFADTMYVHNRCSGSIVSYRVFGSSKLRLRYCVELVQAKLGSSIPFFHKLMLR